MRAVYKSNALHLVRTRTVAHFRHPSYSTIRRVDLRSDTVTKPSPGMLDAMRAAKVGDDVYEEDPTVIELEKRLADMAGMENGMFVPSGTMGNLIALGMHCNRGDEILIGDRSHIFYYEGGGAR